MKLQHTSSRPILAAVDFSPTSAAALCWAARIGKRLEVPVIALHVVHDPESAPGYYARSPKREELQSLEESAGEMMTEFLTQIADEHPDVFPLRNIASQLVVGLPVTRIVEFGIKLDAFMIVVGSQGRTGLPHLLLGSKALRVAQLAPMPVTIVKQPTEMTEAPE